jgi:hypothetical protein
MNTLRTRLEYAIAEMRRHEIDLRGDGMFNHANTYEHCASLAAAALEEAPAAGCPCEPEGRDGLRCPDANGRLLCAPEQPGSSVQGEACSPGEAAPPPSTPAQHYLAERHVCPQDSRYYVLLDPSEAYPDDPSNGAPAMVYGPNGASGTFHCVLDNGSINWGDVDAVELPGPVYRWLESISEYVEAFVDRNDLPHKPLSSPAPAAEQGEENCNCSSGRGAEHCIVHAPNRTQLEARGVEGMAPKQSPLPSHADLWVAAQQSGGPTIWERFPGWLIDHCEGQTLTEEMLQRELAAMMETTPNPVRAEQPEGKGMKVGDTIMVPAYVAYPGSRVSDLLIGGRDGPFVQVPNSMLATAPAAPGVRVDEATLRQALHAMKRCKQESPSGKSWDMPIEKLTAALAPDGGKGE